LIAAALVAGSVLLGGFEVGVPGPAPAEAQMGEDVTLDASLVDAFIRTYPEMKSAAEAIAARYDVDTGGDPSALAALMTATEAWGELNGVATANGFSDFGHWLQVTISVARAYGFAESGAAVDQGMAEALDAIRSDPNLSDAQKEMLITQMRQAAGTVTAMAPPAGNLEAVKPYMAELKALFER
jgi:hypothetical protein